MAKKGENSAGDVRLRIIKCASKLFLTRGIKDVKMDDIAKELSMSKRTIYERFPDKQELLFECLKRIHIFIAEKSRPYLRDSSHSSLDVALYLYDIYFNVLSRVNKKFFIELARYPEVQQVSNKHKDIRRRRFEAWMQKCVDDGFFRKDINFEILLYILQRDIELLSTTDNFPQYTAHELGRAFILFYLRGICTDKGQDVIEEYIRSKEKYEEFKFEEFSDNRYKKK